MNPCIYLDELCGLVYNKFNITISKSTIWKRVKEWGFTHKKITAVPMPSLSVCNKVKRRTFVSEYIQGANLDKVGTIHELNDQKNWSTVRYKDLPQSLVYTRPSNNNINNNDNNNNKQYTMYFTC